MDTQAKNKKYTIPANIPENIFRAYDIRGIVDEQLTPNLVYAVGRAVGSEAKKLGQTTIFLGRDGRLSSPSFADAMATGLRESGVDVIFVGEVPSPVLYFTTHFYKDTQSGVMITGSHNPSNYNGIKIVLAGRTLSSDQITALYERIMKQDFTNGAGKYSERAVVEDYLKTIVARVKVDRKLKIVIDCGNGMGGVTAPTLFKRLGCEVIELFCELDGTFPNHHPDPTVPKNLVDLIAAVKKHGADCGLAFDGDADRLGVVDDQGNILWPDRQVMFFALDLLTRHPGAEIVFDVKCTNHLAKEIQKAGGRPLMWKTGHSILKAKMVERGALLAGEMSGHIFFKEEWFGFDDGVYGGARFLQILARQPKKCSELFAALPNNVNTPELKLMISEENKHGFVERLVHEGKFPGYERITIDGLRLESPHGWALVRASNTTPCLTIRFEANTDKELKAIQKVVGDEILRLDASLTLPF